MNRFKKLIIFSLLGLGVIAFSSCGSKSQAQSEGTEAIPVKTAAVREAAVTLPIRASGIIGSKEQMRLSFKIGGFIKHIRVNEGDAVGRGETLAELDQTEIKAQVEQARVAFEKARRDLQRVEQLYADSVVTKEQLQDATTGFEVAQANWQIAEYNQAYSRITAPTDGTILRRVAEENELAAPGQPIILFSNTTSAVVLRVALPDRDIVRIAGGDSATVTFDAYPGVALSADVMEIGEAADPVTSTFPVELQIDPDGYKLITGLIGTAQIFPRLAAQHQLIPLEGIIDGDGQQGFVFAVDQAAQRVHREPVTIHHLWPDAAAVTSRLKPGDLIVTSGSAYLLDGSLIEISAP